jgi:hypothetical protein
MSAADKLQELAKMLGAAFRTRFQAALTLPEKIDGPVNQPRRTLGVRHDSGIGDGRQAAVIRSMLEDLERTIQILHIDIWHRGRPRTGFR